MVKVFTPKEEGEIERICSEMMDIGITLEEIRANILEGVSDHHVESRGIKAKQRQKLTPIERMICLEYVKDFSVPKTYERIKDNEYYKDEVTSLQSVYLILLRPKVNEKVKQLMEKAEIDSEYVSLGVKEIIERSCQARPVTDRRGKQVYIMSPDGEKLVPAYTFEANAALKGYELLGKNLGMWQENVKHSGDRNNPIVTENTTKASINLNDPVAAANAYADFMKQEK